MHRRVTKCYSIITYCYSVSLTVIKLVSIVTQRGLTVIQWFTVDLHASGLEQKFKFSVTLRHCPFVHVSESIPSLRSSLLMFGSILVTLRSATTDMGPDSENFRCQNVKQLTSTGRGQQKIAGWWKVVRVKHGDK